MALSQPYNTPNFRASETAVDEVSDTQHVIGAIKSRNFQSLVLHYQPQYHSKTLALAGFEALARFRHSAGHIISPRSFIPALSQTNLLPEFDTGIMYAVLKSAPLLQKIYGDNTTLSINVSQNSICLPEFRRQLTKALKKYKANPPNIYLEITETEKPVASIAQLTRSIEEIVDLGIHVSLDDFGTGYSTIEQLARLPISEIKLDRQFVQSTSTEKGKKIVDAISSLGRSVADRVVAEGIETHAQHAHFADHSESFILQGFLYSQPKSFGKLIASDSIQHILTANP